LTERSTVNRIDQLMGGEAGSALGLLIGEQRIRPFCARQFTLVGRRGGFRGETVNGYDTNISVDYGAKLW
jgi:hypothetical protein